MKEQYLKPVVEVNEFSVVEVLTASYTPEVSTTAPSADTDVKFPF